MPSPPDWSRTRVAKKYAAHQAGARKLALRYGEALVCVRHRHAFDGTKRYTTVELLVEQMPIAPRKSKPTLLALRLHKGDPETRRRVIAHGGQWDMTRKVWWVTRRVATQLRLTDRIVDADAI